MKPFLISSVLLLSLQSFATVLNLQLNSENKTLSFELTNFDQKKFKLIKRHQGDVVNESNVYLSATLAKSLLSQRFVLKMPYGEDLKNCPRENVRMSMEKSPQTSVKCDPMKNEEFRSFLDFILRLFDAAKISS